MAIMRECGIRLWNPGRDWENDGGINECKSIIYSKINFKIRLFCDFLFLNFKIKNMKLLEEKTVIITSLLEV